jgi:YjbE family integral membrane protein
VLADLLLAGDNALVIALVVRQLPKREQALGRLWGTIGAVWLRLVFIFIVGSLQRVPLVSALGGAILLWVAWKLLAQPAPGADSKELRAGNSLGEAIRIIVIADVSMSLDNVFAIAGLAEGDMVLVIAGIVLTIPLVVFGSALLSRVLTRLPWLVWLGGGMLAYIAGTMILEDTEVQRLFGVPEQIAWHPLGLGLGVAYAAFGAWSAGRSRRASR